MAKKIYVGNLPYTMTSAELQSLFTPFGGVQSAQIIMDRETGRSKGFGFVEMAADQDAQAAINALSGKDVQGRMLTVNAARAKETRSPARPTMGHAGERRSYAGRY